MRACDAAGYVASGLVLAAFCMRDMISLRVVALLSNLAFLAYGIGLGLLPVCLLHAILLPVNCWRLGELLQLGVRNRVQPDIGKATGLDARLRPRKTCVAPRIVAAARCGSYPGAQHKPGRFVVASVTQVTNKNADLR